MNRNITRIVAIAATLAMACGVGWSLWFGFDPRLIAVQALICSGVALWLIRRPEL